MTGIPSNLGRVPDLLRSQLALSQLSRTNLEIFRASNQLSTGKAINRPSEDAVRSVAISTVQSRLERSEQLSRNLQQAESSLLTLDQALLEANDLLLEAQSIASEQVNFGTSADERAGQAIVIESLIQGLSQIANRESRVGHVFGGSTPGTRPLQSLFGGYRYTGQGSGLTTDLDATGTLPVTLGGSTLLGSVSSRISGTVDLDPDLTLDTRLKDLDGARGVGVGTDVITFRFDGDDPVEVNLAGSETMGDVIDRLTASIRAYETESGVTVLGPGGISISGEGLAIDVADPQGLNPSLEFGDTGAGTTAMDLGIADEGGLEFSSQSSGGVSLAPRLTWTTPISEMKALDGVTLGEIRLTGHGQSRIVDLASVETLQDVRNALEATGLGVRVEINSAGDGINISSEVATGEGTALSIEEVTGGSRVAEAFGIRSMGSETRLDDFNDGRGVRYISGSVNPDSGNPDPTLDIDFTITLGNGGRIDIDLSPQDVTTVGSIIAAINSQATSQLTDQGIPPTLFEARLSDGQNGIVLAQDGSHASMTDDLRIEARNNSQAANDLGLVSGELSTDGSTLVGDDRAKVRPANVFSWLIDLRTALETNDTSGIAIAGERVGAAIDALAETRALVGGYASRVEQETTALEDQELLDQSLLSQLQDADFAQAASRLALLQTQLSAGYQTTATASSLSLINFLR